jgi:hypothetical protein
MYGWASVRAKKWIEGGDVTYYIGEHYEVQNGVPVRHIFGGNLRLATRKGFYAYYYHKDHLGSSMAVTDATGAVVGTEMISWTASAVFSKIPPQDATPEP